MNADLVGDFMGDDKNDALFGGRRRGVFIEQKGTLAEEGQAPVLHGAGREVGHRNQIQFGQRIADAEKVLEEVEEARRDAQREFGLLDHLRWRVNREDDAAFADVLNACVIADYQRHQVRTHGLRVFEIILNLQ